VLDDVKNILIIGGTGTLGVSLIKHLIKKDNDLRITVLSRDEQKHYALKKTFSNVKFILGDIRDKSSISKHFRNIDAVFHVAALKHIDILEYNPIESVKTNILGTINVCESCLENNVKYMMFSTTDKAVDPCNVYGHCKAISEKIILNYNKEFRTAFTVFRWGNIINSNGSALPHFIDNIKKGVTIDLTHKDMSRFFLTIESAIEFVLRNYRYVNHEAYIHPDMKAAKILNIIKIIHEMLGKELDYRIVGLRPGEKIDECMYSKYSGKFMDSKTCPQYTDEELKQLIVGML
jgi:UDP-N-acetylglucosamine 4,6-dehydratase